MTALEQKLLEQLEQEQQLNNDILMNLKNLFNQQNKLIIQNTTEMQRLNKKVEDQQEQIKMLIQNLEILNSLLE